MAATITITCSKCKQKTSAELSIVTNHRVAAIPSLFQRPLSSRSLSDGGYTVTTYSISTRTQYCTCGERF